MNGFHPKMTFTRLLGATALTCVAASAGWAQVTEKDIQPNAAVVNLPPADGFSIRVDGDVLTEDRGVSNIARQVDVALDQADVQVVFDGLGAVPRLDVEFLGEPQGYAAGDIVTLQSALNYPAYVERGEFRVIDLGALGGPRTVLTLPVQPNGQANLTVPDGSDLVVVHRVYDATGRFDETAPLSLTDGDRRASADGVEEGSDTTARRGISIAGGAVTVSGSGVAQGARIATLDETVVPDPAGGFVIQRILPVGEHDVNVQLQGAGQRLDQTRRVVIPASEWFRTGTIDLTYQVRETDGDRSTSTTGRAAAYIDGRTADGVEITASIDTGEGDLDDIFRDLDDKDPRQLLRRVDVRDLYPTYGDDSTLVDNTPTSGKLYLRVAKDGNYLIWGDFGATLAGNTLVRNERTLYGLQAHVESRTATAGGEPRASFDAYAAQPGRLPQRDAFLGTGGSVYFLEKQDLGAGSETVTIQVRDPNSGRVVQTVPLTAGRDYDINYIQGIVTLAKPLQSTLAQTTVFTDPTAAAQAQLVVQYEYTPTATDVDGYSYGLRGEAWVSDEVRIGISGIKEQTGIADQTLVGADLRYQLSEQSFLQLDYAESDGPGFGSTFSSDGGLVVENFAGGTGSGRAVKAEGRLSFVDIGLAAEGALTGYFEDREEGFSSLDTTVGAATGDEQLWGFAIDVAPQEGLQFGAYYDSYENDVGEFDRTGGVQVDYQLTAQLGLAAGLEHVDRNRGADVGERTDLAARLTYSPSDDASIYVFGQTTLEADGLSENDRLGVGGSYAMANGWTLEGEVSDGSLGTGARALATRDDGQGNELYFGYELEPGREISGATLTGRDRGRLITGGKRQVGTDLSLFGENAYDMFGQRRSLTSAYGLTYVATDALSYSAALELGQVDDRDDTDFDRVAVSLGTQYQDEMLTASGRIEYRTEDGTRDGSDIESETFLLNASARYKLSDSARLLGSLAYARTETDESAILDGTFTDLSLGYAYRPVENDRLNVLARYRFLDDQIGQRVDGTDEDGPRQRSHVFSIDALYDLDPHWTIGGKLAYRASETAATEADDFAQNDAWLAAANVTYHLVHEWDAMVEVRSLNAVQAETSDTSILAAAYKHFGQNIKVGVGYNFGEFSDDLTDLVQDDQGVFLNIVAKF